MNLSFKSTNWIAIIASLLLVLSCEKEDPQEAEGAKTGIWGQQLQDVEAHQDFELRSEWLPDEFQSNLKSSSSNPNQAAYNIFGTGKNSIDGSYKTCIMENRDDYYYNNIINTWEEEDVYQEFIVSSKYSEIDRNTSSAVAASVGIDTWAFDLDASISVENQSSISNKVSSLYVSIVRYRQYGYANLTETHSRINDYLRWSTNHGNSESSSCNVPNSSTWKFDTYGDRYVKELRLGYIINATIEITNVDYQSSSRTEVEGAVKASVKKVFNGQASWESIKSNDSRFTNSELVIRAKANPSVDMIYSFDDLKARIATLDQKFNNGEHKTFAVVTQKWNIIYPSCSFIDGLYYTTKKRKWKQAKLYLEGLRTAAISDQALTTRINNEISICNTNINKCLDRESGIPDPGGYEELYTDVLRVMSPAILKIFKGSRGRGPSHLDIAGSNGTIFSKCHRINIEPEKLIPVYVNNTNLGPRNSTTLAASGRMAFFIFDYQYDSDMIPLVEWTKLIVYQNRPGFYYGTSTSIDPDPDRFPLLEKKILGYVYPN